PCTMTGRSALACLIVTLSTALIPPDVVAQHIAEGGAGLYFGNTSGLNGPVLFVRHLKPTGRGSALGFRLEFRDDDDGGGRSQACTARSRTFAATPSRTSTARTGTGCRDCGSAWASIFWTFRVTARV